MLLGEELLTAIQEMGLNKNSFAKLVGVSPTAVANWINSRKITPEDPIAKRAESVLKKKCRCCGQYTENENAWNHSKTESGGGRAKVR